MKLQKLATTAIVALAVIVTLSATAPGFASTSTGASGSVSKDLGTKKITLTIDGDAGAIGVVKQLAPGFEKLHPNVTIKTGGTGFKDYYKQLPLLLKSTSSPDLVAVPAVTNLVKDHLLYNLTPYVSLYHWNKIYSAGQLGDYSVGKNLTSLGGSETIAVPGGYYVVGIYWNKKLAAQAGITSAPTTFADFESDLAKAKAAGELPIQLGNTDGSAQWILQEASQSFAGSDKIRNWIWGTPGSTIDLPGVTKAATTLADWVTAGYTPTPSQINGQSGEDAAGKFAAGVGVFLFSGNWDATNIGKALNTDAGYFTFPGPKGVAPVGSSALGVSAKTKNPNAAAAFLNYFHSAKASQVFFDNGLIPQNVSSLKPATNAVTNDIARAFAKVHADNGSVPALSNATPSGLDVLTKNLSDLMAGNITVATFISNLQANWQQTNR